ncbi:hypothetical protein [Streptomyces europaeiscabiei]|uniref:hypothetical protein n=1 Tax=Streptomyces europaeiscabiei TaxID=146819 RepID=UPI0029A21727|nr:hypothetical protein [Streptomyces europaeiscabiei]MDX2757895.1 hypothetical protein [Streptomyces europaeiscabiei]
MDLHAWITQQVDRVERLIEENEWPPSQRDGVRLRCEADRRILARHRLDPNVTYEPACEGCGTYGDMGLAEVDNLNDCPELLDLAHAHGLTGEILVGLDRPQPPEPKPRIGGRLGFADILATPPITTSDVPAALRGPHWKP